MSEEGGRGRVERAAAVLEVGDVLVAEVLDRRGDRAGRAVAERAERPAEDVVALVEQLLEVGLGALALLEPREHLHQPPGALAARRALAAGLVLVELRPAQHRAHHAGGLVEDLQRLGAEHRAGGADALVVERHVEVLGGQDRRRGAARGPELQLVARADAAGEVEQLAQRDAERGLVLAGALRRGRRASRASSPCSSRCPSSRTTPRRCARSTGTEAIDSTLLITVGEA